MDKQFFVVDYDDNAGTGSTIEEALENYRDLQGNGMEFEDLSFYEATKIQVEQKLVVKPVVVKAAPAKKAAPPAKKVKVLNV